MFETNYLSSGADFDETRFYRYRLWRIWNPSCQQVLWVLLNPSTADENVLDPTLRRCEGFSRTLGAGELMVGNIFALRSTDPRELYKQHDPVGPDNDEALLQMAVSASRIICGWGG